MTTHPILLSTATWFIWDDAVRLCKAAIGTGIAAVSWCKALSTASVMDYAQFILDDCAQIRIYYQDQTYRLQEYACVYEYWYAEPSMLASRISEANDELQVIRLVWRYRRLYSAHFYNCCALVQW